MKTTAASFETATSGTPILHKRTRFAMSRLGPCVAAAVILLGGPSALAAITPVATYDFNNNATPAGATAVGSPTYSNGQLVLNGSSCLSMASPISATDNFGMEVICTPTFNDSYNYSLSLNNGANNGWGILQLSGAYQGIGEDGGGFFGNAGAGSAVLNAPVRLALVRAGGVTRIYRNGLEVGTSNNLSRNTLTKFTIGGNQLTTAPVFEGFFKGSIDEVRVFTFAPGAFNPVTDLNNLTVTTTADEDNGSLGGGAGISLREAVNYSPANSRIVFAPSLSGRTIPLTLGQLFITKSLTIDASSLPNGITINANGQSRVMELRSSSNPNFTVDLLGLTLTGGQANQGGAIFANGNGIGNSVRLSLSSCTLSGNSAQFGGGIFSDGRSNGSATLSLSSCTLSSNSVTFDGGGIYSNGSSGSATLSLSSCTLSGNSTTNAGSGGGILSQGVSGNATLSLNNTILAGNTAPTGPDLGVFGANTTTATGNNLMSSSNLETLPANITITADPLLAPLGNYGGPTMTMPPLSNSPAIDAAGTINPGGTDQRGFSRFVDGNAAGGAQLDIGAVEFQGVAGEFNITFDLDFDSDGTPNGVEYAIGTNPFLADANHPANLRLTSFTNDRPNFTFGLDDNRQSTIILRLVRSTDLINFNDVIISNASTNFPDPGINPLQIDDPMPPAGGKAFYRLEAQQRP